MCFHTEREQSKQARLSQLGIPTWSQIQTCTQISRSGQTLRVPSMPCSLPNHIHVSAHLSQSGNQRAQQANACSPGLYPNIMYMFGFQRNDLTYVPPVPRRVWKLGSALPCLRSFPVSSVASSPWFLFLWLVVPRQGSWPLLLPLCPPFPIERP